MQIEYKSRHMKAISAGGLSAKWSADGTRVLRYFIVFQNSILNVHKELSAPEIFLLQHKVDTLMAQWDERCDEAIRKSQINAGKGNADQQSVEAAARLDRLSHILARALKVNDKVDWERLKDRSKFIRSYSFNEPEPTRKPAAQPILFDPHITLWNKLTGKAAAIRSAARAMYDDDVRKWTENESIAEAQLQSAIAVWKRRKKEHEQRIEREMMDFQKAQDLANAEVDRLAANVALGNPDAVIEHATLVLDASDYEDLFEKDYTLDYLSDDRTLLVEYQLPSPDRMPTLKSIRFVPTTGEMKETHISEREQKANYDSACYQICLRTLHELFEADEFENLQRILFNGITTYIDRASGREVTSTIMSVMVDKTTFLDVDLTRVDPKLCFKSLKGVSAASMAALAPVAPVMKLNKEDRRFIDARSVASNIDDATNLASMPWEDFEHLVREVFEREFAKRGGEVKITQSSSDGGVDAVAFDPDPLTGGKIVIQAKRYTRTVGVAAVRDLYGTMLHERASRGILVTTADYGPDAYQFSAEKHITLMTGANLLHMLEQQGIAAKIDIRQARQELNLRERTR